MASIVSFNDCGFNGRTLHKSPFHSPEISHNSNAVYRTIEDVATLQKTADKQGCQTNGYNFKNTSDKLSNSNLPGPQFTAQQLVKPAGWTSTSFPPHEHLNCNGTSRWIPSSADVNAQHQQKQEYNKFYPSLQNNYPPPNTTYTNHPALSSSSLTQPPFQNRLEYMHWLQQSHQWQGLAMGTPSVGRPLIIWFIGWVDILSAASLMAYVVYNIFANSISDPNSFMWQLFVGCLGALVKFLMGFGLLTGIKSDDDSNTLWYCRLWIPCQLLFLFCSIFEGIISVMMYASHSSKHNPEGDNKKHAVDIPLNIGLFVYRIICFLFVRHFVEKLKKSVAVTLARFNAHDEEHPQTGQAAEDEEENRNKSDPNDSAWTIMLAAV